MSRPLANRKRELEMFEAIVSGQTETRILLLRAASGLGKTDLLERFAAICPRQACVVRIDLKSAEAGSVYVFYRVLAELGANALPEFSKQLEELQRWPSVRIADNVVFGRQNIRVVLTSDELAPLVRFAALEHTFFSDLQTCGAKVVFLIDAFNAANDTLKTWIGAGFLSGIARVNQAVAVIAGQTVPCPTFEWGHMHQEHTLDCIRDWKDWKEYARAAGIPFTEEQLPVLTRAVKGHPQQMVSLLERRLIEGGTGWPA